MKIPDGGALSHAYIIGGPSEEGRRAYADRLSRAFVCTAAEKRPCGVCAACHKAENGSHPDIIRVVREADKREIPVDRIRAVRADAAVLPNEAEKKVYIIFEADKMNAQAQNALLKTLEEPPTFAAFLLEAENPELLLPTVRSRCVSLTASAEKSDSGITPRAREFFETLSRCTDTELARYFFSLEKLERTDFLAFLAEIRAAAVSGLRERNGLCGVPRVRLSEILRLLDRADEYALYNVAVGHTVGLLMSGVLTHRQRNGEQH